MLCELCTPDRDHKRRWPPNGPVDSRKCIRHDSGRAASETARQRSGRVSTVQTSIQIVPTTLDTAKPSQHGRVHLTPRRSPCGAQAAMKIKVAVRRLCDGCYVVRKKNKKIYVYCTKNVRVRPAAHIVMPSRALLRQPSTACSSLHASPNVQLAAQATLAVPYCGLRGRESVV